MLQQNVNEFHQVVLDDINKSQRTVFDGLVTNYQPNKLPERIFVSYFLPGFIGKNPNPNWLLEWVSIAGSPSAEVSIVDQAGVELFRVPGVLATQSVLLSGKGAGLSDIFRHSKELANTLVGNTAFLMNALGQKAQEAVAGAQSVDHSRWEFILQRYGVISQEQQSTATATYEQDMFEF